MKTLSNEWMIWFWNTYNMALMLVPSVAAFILKLVALFNPRIPSDKVIDLIKEYWPKGKGWE